VYARFRNAGTAASLDFYVRIYITHWPGAEFTYPASFIPSTRPGAVVPAPLVPGTYLIGERKYTGLAAGASDIVNLPWPAMLVPPQTVVVGGSTVHWHPCLLLEISPHDGPAASGTHVWDDNNLAQKNISIVYADAGTDFEVAAVFGYGDGRARTLALEIDRNGVPPQVRVWVDLLNPRLKERLRAYVKQPWTPEGEELTVTLLEEAKVRLEPGGWERRRGGTITTLPARTQLQRKAAGKEEQVAFTIAHHEGREVAFLAPSGTTRIPGLQVAGEPLLIAIGGHVPDGLAPGVHIIGVNQRDADGTLTGGVGIEVNVTKPPERKRARRNGRK
jgi:hypothetical protein